MAFNISYKFSVTDGFSSPIKKFRIGLKKIGPIMDKVARKVGTGFKSIASGIDKVKSKMLGLSAGVVAFGFLAGRSILEFEKGMNALQAATRDVTQNEMKEMRNVARDLGRTTAFTGGQAAAAMASLGLAGFTAKENIGAIPAVLSLAAAGSLPLVESAGIMSSTMKAFGLEIKDTKQITDILAKAATSAKTTVSLLGFALSNVGSVAKLSHVDLAKTVAILAVLQDKGIQASKASVGLRGAMLKLQKITPESAKAMRKMGVSVKEIKKLMGDGKIIEAFELLGRANLTGERAAQIFGLETANVAAVMADSTVKMREMTKSLRNLNNDAKRMADTKLQGLPGAVKIAASAFESLQLEIGKAGLTNRLIQFSNFIIKTSNRLEKLNPNILSFAVDIGIAIVAINAILIPLATFAFSFGVLAIFFATVSGITFAVVTASVVALVIALGRLATAWNTIQSAFTREGGGFFGALGAFLGTDIEKSISSQNAITVQLQEKLSRNKAQKGLASKNAPTNVNLNGNIDITTSGGASVQSAEVGVSGAGGNLGLNLAGAQ